MKPSTLVNFRKSNKLILRKLDLLVEIVKKHNKKCVLYKLILRQEPK